MEASKRTTTRIGRLCSSTKIQVKKQKKKIQIYDRKFAVHYDIHPWKKPVASDAEMKQ